MKKIVIAIVVLIVVALAAGAFYVNKQINPDPELSQLQLEDLSGKKIEQKDLLEKPLLVNYWATWCAPCVQELPEFENLHAKLKDKVNIVLVSDENAETVEGFKNKKNNTLTYLISKNKLNFAVRPVTVLYNKKGELVAKTIGGTSEEKLMEMIKKLP